MLLFCLERERCPLTRLSQGKRGEEGEATLFQPPPGVILIGGGGTVFPQIFTLRRRRLPLHSPLPLTNTRVVG